MSGIGRRSRLLAVGATAIVVVSAVVALRVSGVASARQTSGEPVITGGSYNAATQELTVSVTPPPDGGIDTLTLYDAPCNGASCSFGGYQGVTYWPLSNHQATSITVGVAASPTGTWYALVHGYCTACESVYSNVFPIPASGRPPTTTTASTPTTTTEPTTTTQPTTTTTTTAKPPTPPPTPKTPKTPIGTVSGMQGDVQIRSSSGRWIKVPANFTFHTNDHLRTGSTGRLMLTLADGTIFSLGPGSDLLLDEFVYVPNQRDTIAAKLSTGIFRWVTGKKCSKTCGEKVTLPVGTIGVRGTDFVVRTSARSATVDLHQGAATIRARSGKTTTLAAPSRATVTSAGEVRVTPLSATGWNADLATLLH